MFILAFWCSTLFLLVYIYMKKGHGYWKKHNIPHPKPKLFFGNITDAILLKKSLGQTYTDIYKYRFSYVGLYKIRQPAVLIRDAEIIDTMMTKDFQYFDENDFKVYEDVDPILAKNPFFQSGDKWKITRSLLSRCFTSGKLKAIVPLTVKVSNELVKYIEESSKSGNITFETKELLTKFTTDSVASCAFGLEAKSFVDKEATYTKIVKMMLYPSTSVALKMLITMVFPSLAPILKIKLIPEEAEGYFRTAVSKTLQYRLENNLKRNDFLDIINEMRNSELNYTIDDVLGHTLSFLADGTETSGLALSFTLFQLASNIHCQDELRSKIMAVLEKHNGNITYDSLQEMTYLDFCIQESLRLHPPASALLKICTKPYEFEPINGNTKKLKIDVGTPVVLPIYGMHLDEKYFPEPNKFEPDRFSEENKSSIVKGSYLPFGTGPRLCLGQRFAVLQMKVAIVAVIKHFDLRLSAKMKLPLEYDPKYFLMIAKDGLWLDYHKRSV